MPKSIHSNFTCMRDFQMDKRIEEAQSLFKELLSDIRKGRDVPEKPSLMTQTITSLLKKDSINRKKCAIVMHNLHKRSKVKAARPSIQVSSLKLKPFTDLVCLKQPNKLRYRPIHEPLTYCQRLKLLQKDKSFPYEFNAIQHSRERSRSSDEMPQWLLDKKIADIIYNEHEPYLSPSMTSDTNCSFINWDEIEELIGRIKIDE